MRLKSLLYLLLMLPFLGSCNTEDDTEAIFTSGTWNVVDYYGKVNWSKRTGQPVYNAMANSHDEATRKQGTLALQTISNFTLTFKNDGSFSGIMQGVEFKGQWQADGKERTLHLRFEPRPNTSTSNYNKEYIETLEKVVYYQGDSNYIMLAPEDKNSYIQFTHKK